MTVTVTPFVEDAVEALRALLEAQLPAQLAAVENKYSSSDSAANRTVPLQPPQAVIYGDHQQVGMGLPVIYVYALPGATLTSMGQANQNDGWAEYDVPAVVEVHLQSDDEEIVERMKDRYTEAVFGVVYPSQSLGSDIVVSSIPRRASRGKSMNGDSRVLIWEIVLHILPNY